MEKNEILEQVKDKGYLSMQDANKLTEIGIPIKFNLWMRYGDIFYQNIKDGLVTYEQTLIALEL